MTVQTVVPSPSAQCVLHKDHGSAEPLELQIHHVQPLAMGGPDVAENKALICPNGHRNVHALIRDLDDGKDISARGSRSERKLAQRGYDAWVAASRPGKPE